MPIQTFLRHKIQSLGLTPEKEKRYHQTCTVRGIYFIPGSVRTIDILPNTKKKKNLVALFSFLFSKIFQIFVLMIQDSSFA